MRILKFVIMVLLLECDPTFSLQIPTQSVKQGALQSKSVKHGQTFRMQMGMVLLQAEQFLGTSTFWGGALAGGLHAISGPDHYPAILPRCLGKRWYAAGSIGAVWGVGHSLSAFALGLFAFMIKDRAVLAPDGFISKISAGADLAIGFSMIFVGLLSLHESKIENFSMEKSEPLGVGIKTDLLVNGLFHGMAIDGLPTMMPVLAAGSFSAAASFLLSYGIGGIMAMVAATVFIGHGTASLAQSADFDLAHMIHVSSIGAVLVGSAWVIKAFCCG